MKNPVLFTLILAIALACEKTTVEYTDDPKIVVANPIGDIAVEEGVVTTKVDVSNVFEVAGTKQAQVLKAVQSIQRTDLVSGIIADNILTLTAEIGASGSSEIVIRGEWGGYVAYESFIFSVNAIQPATALNSAIANFQAADYSAAENYFRIVLSKNNEDLKMEAYMGLGFSQMRNNNAFDAYQSLQSSLTLQPDYDDARAGLSLLEYAAKQNYAAAISYGQAVLASNSNYIFSYDDNLDKYDLLVNIALSQYMLQLWQDCIDTIRKIDPVFNPDTMQDQFKTKIFQKLEELVLAYS